MLQICKQSYLQIYIYIHIHICCSINFISCEQTLLHVIQILLYFVSLETNTQKETQIECLQMVTVKEKSRHTLTEIFHVIQMLNKCCSTATNSKINTRRWLTSSNCQGNGSFRGGERMHTQHIYMTHIHSLQNITLFLG